MFNTWTLLFLVAAAIGPAGGQSGTRPDRVDELIRAEMQRQRIPGLSLAVLQDGEIIKAAGYGVADRALKVPATPETVYKIASVSKLFIATGVMSLVQDGRVSLDEPIIRHLNGAPATWGAITVRHLLSHTSGLVREGPGFDPRRRQSDAEVIRSAYARPLLFAPGARTEYSNLGCFVLAEIIRRVSGQPWNDYLTATVFGPLGMDATRATSASDGLPNRAVGYQDNDRLLVGADWPALRPSGAFVSTVLDLAKWDAAIHTSRVIRDSTWRQIWEPVTLNDGTASLYGLGWRAGSLNERRMVYHTGSMLGFRAGFARLPKNALTVIVLMNLDDADVESIVRGVAGVYLPTPAGQDAAAIAAAKQAIVHAIDPALPRVPFEVWLRGVDDSAAPPTWEVNDCGEQTGNPKQDQGRDFPLCVEAMVSLAGQRELHVSLVVGTFKKGVGGVPQFWSVYIRKPDGSLEWMKKLSDVSRRRP